ncbi:MAG TPA: O-antigen ligase family protein [Alphaproteobacteria bacterium]|nr:O-antigen ligase family protein [Alphaproteobacteria bacterium]
MAERPIFGWEADRWVAVAVLWLTFALCCVVGLLTPYIVGVIGIAVFVALAVQGRLIAAYQPLPARLFLLAFAILGVCFAITAQSPTDALRVFNFTALLLVGPFMALMLRSAGANNSLVVARLAATGAAMALAAAALGRYVIGWERAESPIFGAILLGNTAVVLGFLGACGLLAATDRRDQWFLGLAPLMGVAAAAMTASRGPMLAIVPLVLLCAMVLARRWRLPPVRAVGGTLAYLAICAVLIVALNDRIATVADVAGDVAASVAVDDVTSGIRLALYEAGLRAFLDAPVLGHGWARLMSAVGRYLPDEIREFGLSLPHLHNDVIDFAVAAGVVGIAVYLLLIATPLFSAWRSSHDVQWPFRMLACAVLSVAYVCDGLTDLMFGMEFHTALYAYVAAIILGYCREPVTGPE